MTNPTIDPVSRARAQLLLESKPSAAFLATLAMQLQLVPTDRVETASTDGTTLWYNVGWCRALPPEHLQGVVAHEVFHCAMLHPYRRGNRDLADYNQAADHVTNLELKRWGFSLPEPHYADPQYAGMSVEQVYAKLTAAKQTKQQGAGKPQEGAGNAPQGGETAGNQPQNKHLQGATTKPSTAGGVVNPQPGTVDSTERAPAGQKPGLQGAGSGPKPSVLPGCATGDFVDPDATPQVEKDGEPGPPPMTAEDWTIVAEQAALAARAAGFMPGSLDQFLSASRKVETDWRAELKQYVTQHVTSEQSWVRPNRRFIGAGVYLPGPVRETVGEIVVFNDMSGSTRGPMRVAFTDQMQVIIEEVQPERVRVVHFDARVHRVETFERGDEFVLNPAGGGGTLFQPCFDYVEREGWNPLVGIMLTDLYCGDRPQAPSYPMIWCAPNWINKEPPFEGHRVALDVV